MSCKSIAVMAVVLLIASLANGAMALGFENFGALDNAALFPEPGHANPGFGPRLFINGMPPVPALPPDKRKRQEPIQCEQNKHNCLEIGPLGAGLCCDNDQYCFIDADWQPKCCAIGAGSCGGPCPESALFCNATVTTTTTLATSATITVLQQTSVVPTCCGRKCSSSYFLCQDNFGGQCCAYGARCASGNSCLFTPTATSVSTIVTPIPPGCTTSQITCTEGGGCCNFGSTCSSTVLPASTSPICVSNLTVVDSGGLSEGARVGIGVGISVGAAIVIGALTWFFIHRRREAKSRRGDPTQSGSGRDGRGREEDLVEPFMRNGPMSEITSPSTVVGRPRLHETGLAYEYFGPDAVAGPFTDSSTIGRGRSTEPRSSPGFTDRGAVPATGYPDGPNGFMRPVELDAEGKPKEAPAELGEEGVSVNEKASTATKEEEAHGPFELYGSPGTSPTPMNPEEAEHRRTQVLSPTPTPSPPPPPESNQQEEKGEHK